MELANTKEAIDFLLTDHHQLDESKIATSSTTRLRARATRNLQRIAIRVWGMRDWTFRYVDDASGTTKFTVANNSEVTLPAPWASEGYDGGVWLKNEPKTPLRWRRSGVLANERNGTRVDGPPSIYTVVGLRKLQGWPFVTEDTPLTLRYRGGAPSIVDTITFGADGLSSFPADWRYSVLYEWLVWYEMKDKGDVAGMRVQMDEVIAPAVFDMCCGERQGAPWEEDLPRFGGSADIMAELLQ